MLSSIPELDNEEDQHSWCNQIEYEMTLTLQELLVCQMEVGLEMHFLNGIEDFWATTDIDLNSLSGNAISHKFVCKLDN